MSRLLLILPSATYRAPDFLEAAARLGAEVVVGCEEPQAMAESMRGRAVVVPCSDPEAGAEAIERFAAEHPVDAVVAVDDQGVLVAARAAERLGLPHNPVEAVARTRDKAAMRRALRGSVRQPEFTVVGADADVGDAARVVGFPAVVKPVALSASRGVIRVDDPAQARETAERIRRILAEAGQDPAGPLVVETYVPGGEVALEGLLRGGALEVLAIFDKPDPLTGPFFEETIYVTPSRLPEPVQAEVAALATTAASVLGLREGPVHAEMRIAPDGVVLLELAARSIGGLCARTLRFGLGISLEEIILRHALGRRLGPMRREREAAGVMMLPIPATGKLRSVDGTDAARAVPGIVGLEITVPVGSRVVTLPEGDRYLGFMFARAERPEQVEEALRAAHGELDVQIA